MKLNQEYSEIRNRIETYFDIHQAELIQEVCCLIQIQSVHGMAELNAPFGAGPAAALEEILALANEMGFTTTNYDFYIGAIDFCSAETQLDILAHLDVVPAEDNWTVTQPFVPVVQNGKIYGRGAADDKGPAIAALFAMRAVKDLQIPLRKNVRLLLGTDEESGSRDIQYYYSNHSEAPMTFSPDAEFPVVNVEKGGIFAAFEGVWPEEHELPRVCSLNAGLRGNIIPEQAYAELEGFSYEVAADIMRVTEEHTKVNFSLTQQGNRLQIFARGKSAHASQPEAGNNALTALLEFVSSLPAADTPGFRALQSLHSMFPHGDWKGKSVGIAIEDHLSGPLTLCCTVLHYGNCGLVGSIDSRIPACASKKSTEDILVNRFRENHFSIAEIHTHKAHCVSADSPFVQTLVKCYREYTGRTEGPTASGGSTYVHNLKNGVAFGCAMPETDNHMHGADEFVVIKDLVTSAKIFTQVIIDLCS